MEIDMVQTSRPCNGCGHPVLRINRVSSIKHYCTTCRPGPRTTCVGCGEPVQRSGNSYPKFCSDECKPHCSVNGCVSPVRKRGWCASHYHQARVSGQEPEPFKWKWAEVQPCLVCGSEERACELRRFCSWACRQLYVLHDGNVPASVGCILCGTDIDLTVRTKTGRRKNSSTKLCRPCRQDYNKYKMSARQLALRDGPTCGICKKPVDMSIRRSENAKWCASVDHILPRALGGSHEPDNLQLAHLHCNQVKSDLRGAMP